MWIWKTKREADEAIAVYTYGHFVRARITIAHTRQGASNLRSARTHFAPLTSERDNNLRRLCFATSVRAGFGRCFDGETKPDVFRNRASQAPPFARPGGFPIDSS
jgi:hypothetical protein